MLKIFICEDNDIQRREIESYIKNHILIEELDMVVKKSTSDPYQLLDYLENHPCDRGIYFLDVDLKSEINGIQVGAKIREKDIFGKIVFITTHSELLALTFKYKVEALDYILKDDELVQIREKIAEALNQANKHLQQGAISEDSYIRLKVGNQIRVFDIKDVMFFETSPTPHKLILHSKTGTVEFYGKINEVPNLSPFLIKAHKSYVVNYKNITLIDKKKREITMINGETCLLSFRQFRQLENTIKTE